MPHIWKRFTDDTAQSENPEDHHLRNTCCENLTTNITELLQRLCHGSCS